MENNFSKIQSKYLFYAKWVNDNTEEKTIAVIVYRLNAVFKNFCKEKFVNLIKNKKNEISKLW